MGSGSSLFTAPPNYLIPVFVRGRNPFLLFVNLILGGYILPRQRPDVTTTLARQHEMQLLIALGLNPV